MLMHETVVAVPLLISELYTTEVTRSSSKYEVLGFFAFIIIQCSVTLFEEAK